MPLISTVLAASLIASAAGVVIVLVNSSSSAAQIRTQARAALLLSDMQESLESSSTRTAAVVANLDPMQDMADHDSEPMSEGQMMTEAGPTANQPPAIGPGNDLNDPELDAAFNSFRAAAGELRLVLGPDGGQDLDLLVERHYEYEASIVTLYDLEASNGDAMGAYHGSTQLLESELRAELLELQTNEAFDLQSAINRSAEADLATRWLVPVLVGLALLIAGYLLSVQFQNRRQEIARLHQVGKDKDEFIASVSHELRTPLTSVYGFLEVLQEEPETMLADERAELLGLAAREALDLTNLVEDLLVIAKFEAGGLTSAAVPVTLRNQLAQVLEGYPHAVDVRIEGNAPLAVGDPSRVRQVLRNLIDNAVRYGGDHIVVRMAGSGTDFARLEVIDDGGGIPIEHQERIFEPYHRAHNEPGVPGSIGLGLAVSRRLTRVMGGDLTYRQVDGHNIFELALPTLEFAETSKDTHIYA